MTILDTNALSELTEPEPSQHVVMGAIPGDDRHHSHYCRGDLARLPRSRRRSALGSAATALFDEHAEATLSFTVDEAPHYAAIAASREQASKPIKDVDAQIAAICRRHQVPLATRNVKVVDNTGVLVVNPWADPSDPR